MLMVLLIVRIVKTVYIHSVYMESSRVLMFRPQVHAVGGHGSQVVYPMALFSPQLDIFSCLLYDHYGDVVHRVSR